MGRAVRPGRRQRHRPVGPGAHLPALLPGGRRPGKDGSGLGLFMVQQAARLHGGSVTVDSRIGEGSTFIVRLPLAE